MIYRILLDKRVTREGETRPLKVELQPYFDRYDFAGTDLSENHYDYFFATRRGAKRADD